MLGDDLWLTVDVQVHPKHAGLGLRSGLCATQVKSFHNKLIEQFLYGPGFAMLKQKRAFTKQSSTKFETHYSKTLYAVVITFTLPGTILNREKQSCPHPFGHIVKSKFSTLDGSSRLIRTTLQGSRFKTASS